MEQLDQKLEKYATGEIYPFHMPGHKRAGLFFPNPYQIDITEIDGFDNLHHPEGILKDGMAHAAKVFGAKQTFYLVNGSTCGLLAAVSAAVPKRGRLLMARNCHKAVYHAAYLRELSVDYLYPQITEAGIQGAIRPDEVRLALAGEKKYDAVVITSPTYDGVVSDIEAIARIVHEHGIPLIVDEAHGAHFGFSEAFPVSAKALGADVVIQSIHKTLPAFTQTALLHLQSDRVSEAEMRKFLGIYETSSPSYIFMAGIEKCVRMLENREILENINFFFYGDDRLKEMRPKIQALPDCNVVSSVKNNIEIGGINSSKAHALEILSQKLEIPREGIMSFGDAGNDIPMIRYAGMGVAVGNAWDDVKAAADYVAESNDEDGVGRTIRRFALGEKL